MINFDVHYLFHPSCKRVISPHFSISPRHKGVIYFLFWRNGFWTVWYSWKLSLPLYVPFVMSITNERWSFDWDFHTVPFGSTDSEKSASHSEFWESEWYVPKSERSPATSSAWSSSTVTESSTSTNYSWTYQRLFFFPNVTRGPTTIYDGVVLMAALRESVPVTFVVLLQSGMF